MLHKSAPLKMVVTNNAGVTVMDIQGRIDSITSGLFLSRLNELIDGGCNRFIIDFSRLSFISSVGLRVLLVCDKKIRPRDGKIILCGLSTDVQEVFKITEFSTIFPVCKNREEALVLAVS